MIICKEKDCSKQASYHLPSNIPIYCFEHKEDNMIKTKGDAYRNHLVHLKKQLGGECVNCKCRDLFKLEFDHIDPSLKTKQITKISKSNIEKELENIQLLCGNRWRY